MWKLLELRKNHLHVHVKFTYVFDSVKVWREFGEVLQRTLFEYSHNFARHVD